MFDPVAVANASNIVMSAYPPPSPPATNWDRASDLITHAFFTCGTRRTARALSRYVPVYYYHWSFPMTNFIEYALFGPNLLGDYHASELTFVFANQWPPLVHDFNANDTQMAATMGSFWSNFAVSGSPNTGKTIPGSPNWPLYNATTDMHIELALPLSTGSGLLKSKCDMWDEVMDYLWAHPAQ